MITYPEYMMLKSVLRPTIRKQYVYYINPRQWLTWEGVIKRLQEKGLLDITLTDDGYDYGYMVIEKRARQAMAEYRLAGTYKAPSAFENFINNELFSDGGDS